MSESKESEFMSRYGGNILNNSETGIILSNIATVNFSRQRLAYRLGISFIGSTCSGISCRSLASQESTWLTAKALSAGTHEPGTA